MLMRLSQALDQIGDSSLNWTYQRVTEGAGSFQFDRCWTTLPDGCRLHVHRMPEMSINDEIFWHPHALPTAIFVVSGEYELYLAQTATGMQIPDQCISKLRASGPFWYEMNQIHVWHAVRTLSPVTTSVMLTAPERYFDPDYDKSISLMMPDLHRLTSAIMDIMDRHKLETSA